MIRGLYTSATGMNAGIRRQDLVANNLANATTPGFKRTEAVFSSLLERQIHRFVNGERKEYLGTLGSGSDFRQGANDLSIGSILPTQNNLDIAIANPDVYLAVEHQGNIAYTRNGQLLVDEQGFLRHISGAYVLNGQTMQRLQVQQPEQLVITADGGLQDAAGQSLGQLQLVQFYPTATQSKMGDSLITTDQPPMISTTPGVRQGALEQSNVQVVKEMVNLIAAMRYYEANAKLIQIQDETLDRAANEIGRT